MTLVEMRWNDGVLQMRQRGFQVDAGGAFCGVTGFDDWENVGRGSDEWPDTLAYMMGVDQHMQALLKAAEQILEWDDQGQHSHTKLIDGVNALRDACASYQLWQEQGDV